MMIMMNLHTVLNILARILLVSYFLNAGLNNIRTPKAILGQIKAKSIPLPIFALVAVFMIQILGSLMVITNWYATIGALSLILFTLASNMLFCTFWSMEGFAKQLTRFLFSANIAIIGGLLLIVLS